MELNSRCMEPFPLDATDACSSSPFAGRGNGRNSNNAGTSGQHTKNTQNVSAGSVVLVIIVSFIGSFLGSTLSDRMCNRDNHKYRNTLQGDVRLPSKMDTAEIA